MKRDPSELLRDGLCSNQTLEKEEAMFGGLRVTVVRKSSLASIPSTEASCYQGQFRLPAFIIAICLSSFTQGSKCQLRAGNTEKERTGRGSQCYGNNWRKPEKTDVDLSPGE